MSGVSPRLASMSSSRSSRAAPLALAMALALGCAVGGAGCRRAPEASAPTEARVASALSPPPTAAASPAPPADTAPAQRPSAAPRPAPTVDAPGVDLPDGLRPPRVLAGEACALGLDDATVFVGVDAVRRAGRRIAPLRCRPEACDGPSARAQLDLDALGRDGEVVVVAELARQLRAERPGRVAVVADGRVSARALSIVVDSVRAAGAAPELLALDPDGALVTLPLARSAPEVLPEAQPRPGREALPADVQAAVVELERGGVALAFVREGGGLLRRPLQGGSVGLAAGVADVLAQRPELALFSVDVGPGVGVAGLYAAFDALLDRCVRDERGACIAPRPAAAGVDWVLRGGARWAEGEDDPERAGSPPLPPPQAEAIAPPSPHVAAHASVGAAALPSRHQPAAPAVAPGTDLRPGPTARGAGLDPRTFLPTGGPDGRTPGPR